jgi:hypothetical protein
MACYDNTHTPIKQKRKGRQLAGRLFFLLIFPLFLPSKFGEESKCFNRVFILFARFSLPFNNLYVVETGKGSKNLKRRGREEKVGD